MQKLRKPQIEALSSILASGGVVPSSEWTNGSGRHTTRRTVPPHCELLDWWKARQQLRGEVGSALKRLLKARPQILRVVAVTNLRAARKAVKS